MKDEIVEEKQTRLENLYLLKNLQKKKKIGLIILIYYRCKVWKIYKIIFRINLIFIKNVNSLTKLICFKFLYY